MFGSPAVNLFLFPPSSLELPLDSVAFFSSPYLLLFYCHRSQPIVDHITELFLAQREDSLAKNLICMQSQASHFSQHYPV